MNNIPIFIHHETGEKKQAGRDNKQNYLKYCIQQAEKFDNKVILFGDNYNKEWCSNWVNINELNPIKWKQFIEVFENYSTYPEKWAKGIFYRFFLFEEYAKLNNIKSFFVLDSDILVYDNLETIYDWKKIDFAAIRPESNQLGDEIENEYRWTINAGVSYWSKVAIEEFTSYCIDMYQNHKDILTQKWDFHKKYTYPGGVCEMSLLYLWIKNNKNIRFLNLAEKKINGGVFNSNIMGNENYIENEFKYSKIIGLKKIYRFDDRLFLKTQNNELLPLYNIHIVGDSKMLMHDYYYYYKLSIKTYIIYLFYNLKKNIALLFRNIKRWKNG